MFVNDVVLVIWCISCSISCHQPWWMCTDNDHWCTLKINKNKWKIKRYIDGPSKMMGIVNWIKLSLKIGPNSNFISDTNLRRVISQSNSINIAGPLRFHKLHASSGIRSTRIEVATVFEHRHRFTPKSNLNIFR